MTHAAASLARTSTFVGSLGRGAAYGGLYGGAAGFIGGLLAGTSIVPILGTIYGAFIGAAVGAIAGFVFGGMIGAFVPWARTVPATVRFSTTVATIGTFAPLGYLAYSANNGEAIDFRKMLGALGITAIVVALALWAAGQLTQDLVARESAGIITSGQAGFVLHLPHALIVAVLGAASTAAAIWGLS